VLTVNPVSVMLAAQILLTLTGVALVFGLWKGSRVVQLDPQDIERLFDLHVDKRWNGIERRNGVDRRSGQDRRSGFDRRRSAS